MMCRCPELDKLRSLPRTRRRMALPQLMRARSGQLKPCSLLWRSSGVVNALPDIIEDGATSLQQGGNNDAGYDLLYKTGGIAQSRRRPHIDAMHLELTEDERATLLRTLKHALDTDRHPLSPWLYPLQPILLCRWQRHCKRL